METVTKEQLKAWREKHGLSQILLGKILGKTTQCIFRYEKGNRPIPAHFGYTLLGLEVSGDIKGVNKAIEKEQLE